MGKTSIEWTDHSWPVVNGCRRVSRGCENCYAERLTATRLSSTPKYQGLAVMKAGPTGPARPRWTGLARLWAPHLDMPLRLKKPSRIFVADMGDLFFEEVPDETIAAVFGVMAACPQHTFQVLTKRPDRAQRWMTFRWYGDTSGRAVTQAEICREEAIEQTPGARQADGALTPLGQRLGGYDRRWPLPNVWLGVSVEDQYTADARIPLLLDTPAAVRFVSAEPLIGPVELTSYLRPMLRLVVPAFDPARAKAVIAEAFTEPVLQCQPGDQFSVIPGVGVDWVIVGGESGPGARPFDVGWARSLVEQCRAAGAPCFVKQLGAWPFERPRPDREHRHSLNLLSRKGSDPEEWPADLRVREFPTVAASNRPGKSEVLGGDGEKNEGITVG